jgi:hypothetical protein
VHGEHLHWGEPHEHCPNASQHSVPIIAQTIRRLHCLFRNANGG